MFPYSANVVEPIMLFDELMRLGQGDSGFLQESARGRLGLADEVPHAKQRLGRLFRGCPGEHGEHEPGDSTGVRPLRAAPSGEGSGMARACPQADRVGEDDAEMAQVHRSRRDGDNGAGGRKHFCCNLPNQCCDSHSARLAAVEALYYAKTGDIAYKRGGLPHLQLGYIFSGTIPRRARSFSDQWWFTDEFADGPRRMMDAFWAVPEWAPADESHLLWFALRGDKNRIMDAGSVTYSTFDADSTDVLRLDFVPDSDHGWWKGHQPPQGSGSVRDTPLTKDHDAVASATPVRDVESRERSDSVPASYITFDDPHLPAGTPLVGQYPSGVIDWGSGELADWHSPRQIRNVYPCLAEPEADEGGNLIFTLRTFLPAWMFTTMARAMQRLRFGHRRRANSRSPSRPRNCAD